jgi:cbb3-type cytochrome oxidase subunit 3
MEEAWRWITDLANSKMAALVIFFSVFVGIVLYVYSSRRRSRRLESYKYIPFQDENDPGAEPKVQSKDEQRH